MGLGIWRGFLGSGIAALLLLASASPTPAQTVSPAAKPAATPARVAAKPHPQNKTAAAAHKPARNNVAAAAKKPLPAKKTLLAAKKPAALVKTAAHLPKPATPPHAVAAAPENAANRGRAAPATAASLNVASAAEHKIAATPISLAPVVVTGSPSGEPADPKAAAADFVTAFLKDAFRLAKLSGATSLQRRAQLADLFNHSMDVGRIAGYTTADGLTTLSPELQQRFRTILVSYLVETYYPQLELASDPGVRVETAAANPLADGTAVVWTTFTKAGWGSQSVKWHLAAEDGGYRIVDIFSAGASLVQMERDTFQSVMRNGGVSHLMAQLDARTRELASAATD